MRDWNFLWFWKLDAWPAGSYLVGGFEVNALCQCAGDRCRGKG